ncbi:MAG: AAA family ATPase [Muribaculaceae bacterium]|nr:AAA family ATPase [Muribaculaceae bacterium]
METLKKIYRRLLKLTPTNHVRPLYDKISWEAQLIGIKGARGVGKTTMLLQRIKLAFPNPDKALYVSLDNIWFAAHSLLDLAEIAEEDGITHLFLDEVHRMRGWEQQIKNVYDSFPELKIAFTGSSLLVLDHSIADLSRRTLIYHLPGLSFREYLIFEGFSFPSLSLQDILFNHVQLASDLSSRTDVLTRFHKYLKMGYFPFYSKETEEDYLIRVNNIITSVIDNDIPAVENVEYATLMKAKQLLTMMASQSPSPLNVKLTADLLQVSPNQLIKILSLLDKSQILRLLYFKSERNPKSMVKPQKVLLGNSSLLYALGYADKGKVRESFFASMLTESHQITYPQAGDLLADGRYLFEIGGARKGFDQIKDIPDSFVVADDIPYGIGNKIPLWLFGFLY